MPLNETLSRDIPQLSQDRKLFTVDDSCFQILHLQDILTVKAPSVSEKRKWLNQMDTQCSYYINVEKKLQEKGVSQGVLLPF